MSVSFSNSATRSVFFWSSSLSTRFCCFSFFSSLARAAGSWVAAAAACFLVVDLEDFFEGVSELRLCTSSILSMYVYC